MKTYFENQWLQLATVVTVYFTTAMSVGFGALLVFIYFALVCLYKFKQA
jgi:hypothetical protein